MGKTSIPWTDYSWPVINGCRRASPGCENCYSERLSSTRLSKTGKYGGLAVFGDNGPRWTGEARLWEQHLDMPLKLQKPSKIFVCDMGDLFYAGVPKSWIDRVWARMLLCPRHTFQVLTKRVRRMREYLTDPGLYERLLRVADHEIRVARPKLTGVGISNPSLHPAKWIWLGVSVENQEWADDRIPDLLETPAAVRFVSYEPAIGPVDFERIQWPGKHKVDVLRGGTWELGGGFCNHSDMSTIDQVIVGGESGPGARPFDVAWARGVIRQCRAAGVSAFCKQLGANVRDRNDAGWDGMEPESWPAHIDWPSRVDVNGYREDHRGAHVRVRLFDRKGEDMSEWPSDIRVREFPRPAAPPAESTGVEPARRSGRLGMARQGGRFVEDPFREYRRPPPIPMRRKESP